jgi:GAF domain-containing protein
LAALSGFASLTDEDKDKITSRLQEKEFAQHVKDTGKQFSEWLNTNGLRGLTAAETQFPTD